MPVKNGRSAADPHTLVYRTRLKALREAHKLTQKDIAAYIGVQQAAVAKYERNQLDMPTSKVVKLLDLFHCDFTALIEW